MSKKKRKKSHANSTAKDFHHILWQKRHWKSGWSKRLREHPYCGAYIPKATLHRHIHEQIGDIPVPDGKYCKIAYEAIQSWLEGGYISMDDTLEQRIETLLKCFRAKCPDTAKALQKQLNVVNNFYGEGQN